MKQGLVQILTAILALSGIPVFAYDPVTHEEMSEKAFNASAVVTNSTLLDNLGLPSLSAKKKYPNSQFVPEQREIFELFRDGANFEDGGTRSTNHFFDPLKGEGIKGYSPSPDWAIDGTGDASTVQFSFKAAREYLWQATANGLNSYDYRQKQFGLMFETLGHVIHHVQDMAQPQHVRMDLHCDIIPCYLIGKYNKSMYESFTLMEGDKGKLTYTGYEPVYSSAETVAFSTARNFWTTTSGNGNGGKGIAEYTNRNFVSAGTNFDISTYVLPSLSSATELPPTDITTLCAEDVALGYEPCPSGLSGVMIMYSSTVTDNYRPSETKVNLRTSTQSIYDQDLKDAGKGPIFSLNRFNYHNAQQFLIPRAVGYSAGLINYFFRGKMEITLPDEGVYAIVDHAVENQKDTSGFRKIKLKLKNVTPRGSGIEPMAVTGKLVAVAKFHRNTCYETTLSGEYGAPGVNKITCRSANEDIVVSTEINAPDGINAEAKQLEFTFPTPIPINATDIYLQVVYRGPLGDETDAVVVATKDIAEPNFFGHYDTTEQFLYGLGDGSLTFKQLYCDSPVPPIPYDECKKQDRRTNHIRFTPPVNFDTANPEASFNATMSFIEVPVSQFARVAFLSDTTNQQVYSLFKNYPINGEPWVDTAIYSYSLVAPVNQVVNDVMTSVPIFITRGVYTDQFFREVLSLGLGEVPSPPAISPLTPVPSQINF